MKDPLEEVQKRLLGDMRGFYSETTIDHAMRPRNAGSLPNPDGFATRFTRGGESLEIWLKARDNRVEDASFWTDGCAATIATGSMATELAKSKTIQDALTISARDVADALDNLPEGNFHCAELAAQTLKAALQDYLALQREPWKKAYRKGK
ncbi:MAG: iron-sulfur cluster assembly scaffold protein [Dehalococcoidia bacterium]|nr:iron-sulfur cluster assembly scaffold protein [Dehalococcoidia bacterium]